MDFRSFILLGPPGSGKGTLASALSKKFGCLHLSTGDLFRREMGRKSPLGIEAKRWIDQGFLVPDELTLDFVWEAIQGEKEIHSLLLDGVPRTIWQADSLKRTLPPSTILLLTLPDLEIIQRMEGRLSCPSCRSVYHTQFFPPSQEGFCNECGTLLQKRDDDSLEVVHKRLQVYHSQTAPLIEWYRKEKEKIIELDASLSPQFLLEKVSPFFTSDDPLLLV